MLIEDPDNECRYCREVEPADDLVKPCKCTSLVHRQCLERWLETKGIAFDVRCEVCTTPYVYKSVRTWYNQIIFNILQSIFFMMIAPVFSLSWFVCNTTALYISYKISYWVSMFCMYLLDRESSYISITLHVLFTVVGMASYLGISRILYKLSKIENPFFLNKLALFVLVFALVCVGVFFIVSLPITMFRKRYISNANSIRTPSPLMVYTISAVNAILIGQIEVQDLRLS